MTEPRRDWTQYDILAETECEHPKGESGFFNTLANVTDDAFGGRLSLTPGAGNSRWVS